MRTIAVIASALSDDPRAAARRAQRAGFGGLLFDALSPSLNIPDLSSSGRREFSHILSTCQQRLVGLRFDLNAKGLAPGSDVDRVLTQFDRVLESAADLQADCVCTDLGTLPVAARKPLSRRAITREEAGLIILPESIIESPHPQTPPTLPPDPVLVSHVNDALKEMGRLADRYSVPIAMSSSLSSFASLHQALSSALCQWFGVDLDPVAILRDQWSIDETFSVMGPLIRHVRARDAMIGADKRTKSVAIGAGQVDWPRLILALDESGYAGSITIDPTDLPDRAAAAFAGRKFLVEPKAG